MIDYNWKKTLSGERTQIRFPVKPDDLWTRALGIVVIERNAGNVLESLPRRDAEGAVGIASVQSGSNYPKYKIGKTYAVQPGGGQKAVARIQILSIRREDVRQISDADVIAEGFTSAARFFDTWIGMHDPKLNQQIGHWFVSRRAAVSAEDAANIYRIQMQSRPAERYDAWALTFEVMK